MTNKKKILIGIFSVVVLTLFLVNFVNAIGVSMYYYEGKPLEIGPGETKEIEVASLIASAETQNKDVGIELLEGSEIASVVNKDINVVAGSVDNKIILRISVDEVAEGTTYIVKIRVNEVTAPEGEGMIGFTNPKVTTMPILVKTPEEPETPATDTGNTWIWVIAILVIVAIVVLYLMKKKK